jgi:hypothetical protein
MSGFSADWLALREGADHAARDGALRDAVAASLRGQEQVVIVDLAGGTGSNLRCLAPCFPPRQSWRLVDWDARLLDAAREKLVSWADEAESSEPLILRKGDRRIEVALQRTDLAACNWPFLEERIDLVSASALFDLVSQQWIEQFCTALARRRVPLYAALTYSGRESWWPPHPADAEMLAAFHRHQARDKGFGPAAGPRAIFFLRKALERRGYEVRTASSPWRLEASETSLITALAEGAAVAVNETGLIPLETSEAWRQARRNARRCEIGHLDLFAQPT